MTLNPKMAVRYLVERLPEDASFEDVQEGVDLLRKIEQGLLDVREGRSIPHEEVRRELSRWLGEEGPVGGG